MTDQTKQWIAETMRKLLVHNSLEKIRVTEICRAAGIERPTFYYHFKDKYDVMAWIFCQHAVQTDVLSIPSAAEGLNKMRENFIFYKRAYEDTSQSPMWAHMYAYFVKVYSDLAREKLQTQTLDTQIAYSIRLYCYGTLGMTREWVLFDNITPAETAAEMMIASMPQNLKRIYYDCEA